MITIYNFGRGARGLRAAWVCEEMGLPYQMAPLEYPVPDDYRARNPMGSVPFLEDAGGVAINESVALMLYLAERYGPTPLLPKSDPALMARVLQFTVFGEASLAAQMNPLLSALFTAPDAQKRNWSVENQEAAVKRGLNFVAGQLGSSPFLAGGAFTLADISVATALGLARGPLKLPLPDPLTAYLDRVCARPAYLRAKGE